MKLQHKSKKFALLLAGIFLLLFSGTPFLHNHAPTPYEPSSCPAHILQISLQSSGVALAAVFAIPLAVARFVSPVLETLFHPVNVENHFSSRAPPSIG